MGNFNGRHFRGYMRLVRERKREEAEARNASTPPERRKAHRITRHLAGVESLEALEG